MMHGEQTMAKKKLNPIDDEYTPVDIGEEPVNDEATEEESEDVEETQELSFDESYQRLGELSESDEWN
jgi:hypothetical protein